MHKCYTFLIFMVLLLPSLGLSRWVQREGMGAGVGVGSLRTGRGGSSGSHVPHQAKHPLGGDSRPYSSPHHPSPPLQPGPLLPLAL